MHIPDNYLSPSTCAVLGAAMLPVWRRAAGNVKKELTRKKMPLLGIGAAFSFLIMMFNLPLPGGTSGHAVGAAIVAILLGPSAAVISITTALAIQALLFGDGGILAFGANTFNMAFVMPFAAYYIYKILNGKSEVGKRNYIAAFAAGYISINIAAFLAAIEFGIQPLLFKGGDGMPLYCPYPIGISVPAMMIPHLLFIGFLEGFVTAGVFAYVKKLSPEIIYRGTNVNIRPLHALIGAMVVLTPLGLLASGTAWGEWGVKELQKTVGYAPNGMYAGFNFNSIMPDYTIAGLPAFWSYIISATAGVVIIFLIVKLIKGFKTE